MICQLLISSNSLQLMLVGTDGYGRKKAELTVEDPILFLVLVSIFAYKFYIFYQNLIRESIIIIVMASQNAPSRCHVCFRSACHMLQVFYLFPGRQTERYRHIHFIKYIFIVCVSGVEFIYICVIVCVTATSGLTNHRHHRSGSVKPNVIVPVRIQRTARLYSFF